VSRLPEAGQRLGIHVPEWNARLVSEVLDAGVGTLTIAFPSDGRSDFDLPAGVALALEWVNPRGLVRVEGRSVGRSDGSGVVVRLSGAPEVVQRRDYVRANTVADLVVTPVDGLTMPATGVTIDISGGGLQASLPGLNVGVDDRVRLELEIPEETAVEADARVTRVPTPHTFCFIFEQIDPREQERLIKFVFQRLRGSTGKAA
jgi:c-di-GMP-binding flagellar brake protein YcgR